MCPSGLFLLPMCIYNLGGGSSSRVPVKGQSQFLYTVRLFLSLAIYKIEYLGYRIE